MQQSMSVEERLLHGPQGGHAPKREWGTAAIDNLAPPPSRPLTRLHNRSMTGSPLSLRCREARDRQVHHRERGPGGRSGRVSEAP